MPLSSNSLQSPPQQEGEERTKMTGGGKKKSSGLFQLICREGAGSLSQIRHGDELHRSLSMTGGCSPIAAHSPQPKEKLSEVLMITCLKEGQNQGS
ncbi:hypothetical protein XELAEV_18038461mg [Xenopus laevis]|uniref:Uncharacterized protein n=1 Tax=Xenopus laevis TaxID=8355 RepID=A0A974C620_XENLA|nr:hypothetical protein XELAEV_18038461mg [Xenopus laevis]